MAVGVSTRLVVGDTLMRLIRLIPAVFIVLMSGPAFAQEWIDYTSRVDMFSVNFPSEPKVQDIPYTSLFGATFPARVYSVEVPPSRYYKGTSRYSVTVVDYTDARRIDTERAKRCNPDAQSSCAGTDDDGAQGPGGYKYDVRGAIDFATEKILIRDAKVTQFGWAVKDLIEGHEIQLTNNADRSRTFVAIHMHQDRLYVFEATVPAGAPEPGIFQQSPRFLDKEGRSVRYTSIYTNGFPATRTGGGRGQGAAPQGQGAAPQGQGAAPQRQAPPAGR